MAWFGTQDSQRTNRSRWSIVQRISVWRRLSPAQVFVGSFLLLTIVGAIGLMYIPGLHHGGQLGWVDALFESTNAVCLTGLNMVDADLTTRGQVYILVLIQVGGLGMLTFASLIIVALGRRLSLRQEALSTGTAEVAPHVRPG